MSADGADGRRRRRRLAVPRRRTSSRRSTQLDGPARRGRGHRQRCTSSPGRSSPRPDVGRRPVRARRRAGGRAGASSPTTIDSERGGAPIDLGDDRLHGPGRDRATARAGTCSSTSTRDVGPPPWTYGAPLDGGPIEVGPGPPKPVARVIDTHCHLGSASPTTPSWSPTRRGSGCGGCSASASTRRRATRRSRRPRRTRRCSPRSGAIRTAPTGFDDAAAARIEELAAAPAGRGGRRDGARLLPRPRPARRPAPRLPRPDRDRPPGRQAARDPRPRRRRDHRRRGARGDVRDPARRGGRGRA